MSMLSCRDECTVSVGKASVDSIEKQERSMNVENAKSQMRKGMLEYCVLLLLSREAGYAITSSGAEGS